MSRPPNPKIDSHTRHAAGRTVEVAGKAVKTTGRTVETAGSGIKAAGRTAQGAGLATRVTGKAMSGSGRAATVTGKGAKSGGKATAAGGKAAVEAGKGLSSTGLGAIIGVPLAALGAAGLAAGKAAEGGGIGLEAGGKAATKTGKGVAKAGKKVQQTGKKVTKAGEKVKDKGKDIRKSGQNIESKGKQTQQAAMAATTRLGRLRDLAAKTGRDATAGPLGWAKIGARTAKGSALLGVKAAGVAAKKLWGGSLRGRGGATKAALGCLCVLALLVAGFGGAGSAARIAADETAVASETSSEEFLNGAQLIEGDMWGDPTIPWEIVQAVAGLATDYGRQGPYPSDGGARGQDGITEEQQIPDSETFPYVSPPIRPTGQDTQSWWWGGHGAYMFNPIWIESLPTWEDVYSLNCLGSDVTQPFSPTGDSNDPEVNINDIEPEDDNDTTPITIVIDPTDVPDPDGDDLPDEDFNPDDHLDPVDVPEGQDPLRPPQPTTTTTTTIPVEEPEATTTTSTTTTEAPPVTEPVDDSECQALYDRLGLDPNAESPQDAVSSLDGFPVPVVAQFDPQHTEAAQWVLAAALRSELRERFDDDGYLRYSLIETLEPYYDDEGQPKMTPDDPDTEEDESEGSVPAWPDGMNPYEDSTYSTVEDPLTYEEFSNYRAAGIAAYVWADIFDELVHRQYSCPSWRYSGATPPSPVPPLPDKSKIIVMPVDCPPPSYFELEPAVPPHCVEWEIPASDPESATEPVEVAEPGGSTSDDDPAPEPSTTTDEAVAAENGGVCVNENPGTAAVMALSPLPTLPPQGVQVVAIAQTLAEHDLYNPEGMVFGLVGSGGWTVGDVGPIAMEAYNNAIARKAEFPEIANCDIDVFYLAAIGRQETHHGTFRGAVVQPDGEAIPHIGSSAGAQGPMQFMPGTWPGYGVDGNGDGKIDPHNIFDAAIAAMRLLCSNPASPPNSLQTPIGRRNASVGYNAGPGRIPLADSALPAETQGYVPAVENWYQQYKASATPTGGFGGPVSSDCAAVAAGPGVPVEQTTIAPGTTIRVHLCLAQTMSQLVQLAQSQGIPLSGGGYRDPAAQINTRRNNCGTSEYAIYQMPASQCSPPTARPGTSMHERGVAVDFTCNGRIIGSRTGACWNFMVVNAARFGLKNLPSEPWHWSVSGG